METRNGILHVFLWFWIVAVTVGYLVQFRDLFGPVWQRLLSFVGAQ